MTDGNVANTHERFEEIRRRAGMPAPAEPRTADAEQLIRYVRDELLRRDGNAGAKGGGLDRWQPVAPRILAKREYTLPELLASSDADFVDGAYRALFQRAPDAEGIDYFLRELRTGRLTKLEILGALRFSPEGMARGVHVDGLLVPYRLLQMRHWRYVGPIVSWVLGVFRLQGQIGREARIEARQAQEMHALGGAHNEMLAGFEARLSSLDASTDARISGFAARAESGIAKLDSEISARMERASVDAVARLDNLSAKFDEQLEILSVSIEDRLKSLVDSIETRSRLMESEVSIGLAEARDAHESMNIRAAEATEAVGQRLADVESQAARSMELAMTFEPFLESRQREIAYAASLDPLYAAFEDEFRGTAESITERLTAYIDMIGEVRRVAPALPVIDLGCGRGEWLELLKNRRIRAFGVDTNHVFVTTCRGKGLEVVEADAVDALSALPNGSANGITTFHLVEHLPFEKLIQLIDQAHRVLRSGGILIIETPNPENLRVASHWFYLDPTHRNPLPPQALRWLVQARGFQDAEIAPQYVGRASGSIPFVAEDVPGASSINAALEHYAAAPDYAVIAWRK